MRSLPGEQVDMVAEDDRAVLVCRVCGARLSVPFTEDELRSQAVPFFAAHQHRRSAPPTQRSAEG